MDTSNILKPSAITSNSKIKAVMHFLAAATLADWVIGNSVYVYITTLNHRGILGLGADFNPNDILWGNSVWLNILHVFVMAFTGAVFGLIFGYLSRSLSLSSRISLTTLYVFIRYILLIGISVTLNTFFPSYGSTFNQEMGVGIYVLFSSPLNIAFMVLGYGGMFASAIISMKFGVGIINNPLYVIDKSRNGTLPDIKWYHYFWLIFPISIYSQILLNLIYKVGHTLVTLVLNFKWYTLLGFGEGDEGNALDIAWQNLLFVAIMAGIVIYLLDVLRKVLSGEFKYHWSIKLSMALSVGLILPILIASYTSLTG